MSRKDTLRALLGARERREGEVPATPPAAEAARQHVRAGAVGAMGRSLDRIAHAAEEARALVAAGETVVELDTAQVEASFMADRFDGSPEEHAALVASIREHGQQVPILVRPHPARSGIYQVAYGHRRLRALKEIGKPVRAVVRALGDAELVVAQGQENSARLDLSFIERAVFAAGIEDRGFERSVSMAALNVEKTQLSRLISVARGVPAGLVALIGPAARTGRPRWEMLVQRLEGRGDVDAVQARLAADAGFRASDSDARFAAVLKAFGTADTAPAEQLFEPAGKAVARLRRSGGRATLVVDEKAAPHFADYLFRHLPEIFERFGAQDGQDGQDEERKHKHGRWR